MALTTTTLSSAATATGNTIVVASATGFATGSIIRIDGEFLQVAQSYNGTSTTIPVLRGRDGTFSVAHNSSANVIVGLASDFGLPLAAMSDAVLLPGEAPLVWQSSYSASGAIAVPTQVGIYPVILNGTSTLTMTLAAPTKDIDGAILVIAGNGKSASTLAVSGNNGIINAGAGYRTITFQNGGKCGLTLMAVNGDWVDVASPITGTTTAISVAIS